MKIYSLYVPYAQTIISNDKFYNVPVADDLGIWIDFNDIIMGIIREIFSRHVLKLL